MQTIELHGRITQAGTLEIDDLPAGLLPGEENVTIKALDSAPVTQTEIPWEDQPWTEDELREALTFRGLSGAEIAAQIKETSGWWAKQGIADPVAWLEKQRRLEQEERERRE